MKKIMIVLVLALLVIGGLYLVRQKRLTIREAGGQPVRATVVRAAVAKRGDLLVSRTYLARVEPWQAATVAAQIVSRVTDVRVQVGDLVSRGGVLAHLESEELMARVQGAEAGVSQARMQAMAARETVQALGKTLDFRTLEFDRDRRLVKAGAIARVVADTSLDQLNEIRGRLQSMEKTAQAATEQITFREQELSQARIRLAYGQITAPFGGVVVERLVDPGDMAGPGQPLVILEDHTRFRISFDVPQAELSWFKPEMAVMALSGVNLELSVSRTHSSLNSDRTLTVECDAPPAPGLRAGGTLVVKVVLDRFEDQVLVPEASLIPVPGGGDAVFIVANKKTTAVPVTVLGRNAGQVAVKGLDPGSQVIQNTYLGWNRLAAGEPVEVLP
ncbi:putative membrane efflux protein [Desulforapulum autotrophicum HRM2]|uniref:Membrane efflux protein n=1 Tax=Desulforapulum autotrophicum (strain ATCC 43914 / DSM 3382 / VKM B-1955 / HRM2) TaxID=177437 RepID=C0QDU5_DESAH|nr:efflux RND transporter periplasmic adaptor subunit [Desulforapulum autotrophicum]ACN17366.1 putative membrane efflux protein [Desulforapulum autotrophicum HRM2]